MSFEEYLTSKKINSKAFSVAEPERWEEWRSLFEKVSEASFTAQKLYLINPIRRKYLLKTQPQQARATATENQSRPAPAKPVFKPKIK